VQRYIRHATEARDLAAQAMPLATKEDCLTMAESWLAMALDCETRSTAEPRRDPPQGSQPAIRT
jgi:hypothetical protein